MRTHFFSLFIAQALCIALVGPFGTTQLRAQETGASLKPGETELPENAIARVGNFGNGTDENGYYRLQYSSNGSLLAARTRYNILEIYDAKTNKQLCQIDGGDPLINTVDFSPDSKSIAVAFQGFETGIRLYSTQTGKLQKELDCQAEFAYFDDDGKTVFGLTPEHLESFNLESGERISAFKLEKQRRQLALSRDGKNCAVSRALRNGLFQIQIVDAETSSKTILDGPTELTKSVQFSPNGLWVAASYTRRDPKIRLWDLRNPHVDKFILKGHSRTVQSLGFSEDGRFLASSSWDKTVIVWDLLTREKVAQFNGHTENVNSVAVNSVDLTVASGASGKTDASILIWDLEASIFKEREIPKAYDSFDIVWKELGSAFPNQAFLAIQAIRARDDHFLPAIEQKIGVVTESTSQTEIAQWIKDLDSPKFLVREEATKRLMAARRAAETMLRETLQSPPSTEVEYRITKILNQPVERPMIEFSELRRLHRSVFALELVGNEAAAALLLKIRNGHPNIDVADDARRSLARVKAKLDLGRTP